MHQSWLVRQLRELVEQTTARTGPSSPKAAPFTRDLRPPLIPLSVLIPSVTLHTHHLDQKPMLRASLITALSPPRPSSDLPPPRHLSCSAHRDNPQVQPRTARKTHALRIPLSHLRHSSLYKRPSVPSPIQLCWPAHQNIRRQLGPDLREVPNDATQSLRFTSDPTESPRHSRSLLSPRTEQSMYARGLPSSRFDFGADPLHSIFLTPNASATKYFAT